MKESLIACFSLEGNLVKTYSSALEASRSRHLHKRTIDKAIRENKIVKNMMWKRYPKDEVPPSIEPYKKTAISYSPRPVGLLDKNGNVIEAYASIKDAAKKNKVDSHIIRDAVYKKSKTAKGKKYRFLSDEEAKDFGIIINRHFGETKVRQYSLDGKLIKVHDSIKDASKSVKVHPSAISHCIRGLSKTTANYYWIKDDEHAEETLAKLLSNKRYFYQEIIQLDLSGKIIAKYKSTAEASNSTGIKSKIISQAIRRNETAGGYYWQGKK